MALTIQGVLLRSRVVTQEGLEPPTPSSEDWCSIQLSYWALPLLERMFLDLLDPKCGVDYIDDHNPGPVRYGVCVEVKSNARVRVPQHRLCRRDVRTARQQRRRCEVSKVVEPYCIRQPCLCQQLLLFTVNVE
jgi:hypothetical protein